MAVILKCFVCSHWFIIFLKKCLVICVVHILCIAVIFAPYFCVWPAHPISDLEMAHMNKIKWNNSETELEKHETIHKWYKQNHREKGILD